MKWDKDYRVTISIGLCSEVTDSYNPRHDITRSEWQKLTEEQQAEFIQSQVREIALGYLDYGFKD